MRLSLANLPLGVAIPYAMLGQAAQIPFQISVPDLDTEWTDMSIKPDINATGNLLFEGVNSLLQHWPNTRYRNGHNIVPGIVPVGTLLYHGCADGNMPTIPEWTATDPEHSYHFCTFSGTPGVSSTPSGCWHLTLAATRPLKVLYLDGSSAANMKDGTLDVQDLLLWGKVDPARWLDERERINKMCALGKEFGIDGFLRMEMDFEVMLCDFQDGVKLISADFLAAWRQRRITPPLWQPRSTVHSSTESSEPAPENTTRSLVDNLLRFEMLRAGAWHNRYPGETRVVLDLTRLVSFYDTALAPSLVPLRAGKARWDHRLQGIVAADLAAVTMRLKTVLAPENTELGSGVDWQTLFRVIVDRYADRLEMLQYLLNTTTPANTYERATTIQMQLRVMLTPYILFSARPGPAAVAEGSNSGFESNNAWAAPVWHACGTRHTSHIHTRAATLTASERLLLSALDGTNREICRVVVRMWAAGVRAGLDSLLPQDEAPVDAEVSGVVREWRAETRALMAWLDWSVWVKCRPACGFEETCYLPTWPYFWEKIEDADNEEGEWKRPQPRCIRQFEPYSRLSLADSGQELHLQSCSLQPFDKNLKKIRGRSGIE